MTGPKGIVGLVLLTLGIGVASSFGARNGAQHNAYRQALAVVDSTEGDAKVEAAAALDAMTLPSPSERLSEWFAVGGLGWLAGLGMIIGGGVLARMQVAEDNRGTGTSTVARVDFIASVDEVLKRAEQVRSMIAELPMDADSDAPRGILDAIASDVLEPLVEGRGQLVARHGIGGFAEYFGTFSGAERNLNRCWSALTDGHSEVARQSLSTSIQMFHDAKVQYGKVDSRS